MQQQEEAAGRVRSSDRGCRTGEAHRGQEDEREDEDRSEKCQAAVESARAVLAMAKKANSPELVAQAKAALTAAKASRAAPAKKVTALVARVMTKHSAKADKRLAKLEAQAKATKVDSMLEKAWKGGKITRSERACLREIGMLSRQHLRALLDARAEGIVRTADRGEVRPAAIEAAGDLTRVHGMPTVEHQRDALALTGRSALTAQPAETQEMVRIGASARGMTSEAFWASMVGTNPELVAGSAAGRLS